MYGKNHRLGQILLRREVITNAQLERALVLQRDRGVALGDALISLGVCTETHIVRALAEQSGMPFVDLETPPPRQILRLLPAEVARELQVVPARFEKGRLVLAARNPFDISLDAELSRRLNQPVVMAVTVERKLLEVLAKYEQLMAVHDPGVRQGASGTSRADDPNPDDPRAVAARAIELLEMGLKRFAGEIRFEPEPTTVRVRGNVDGRLVPIAALGKAAGLQIVRHLKRVCNMIPDVERQIQNTMGRLEIGGVMTTFTARAVPGVAGELFLLSLQQTPPEPRSLSDLGFEPTTQNELLPLIHAREGILLVIGPAGSGRTTALYSILNLLDRESLSVIAVHQDGPGRSLPDQLPWSTAIHVPPPGPKSGEPPARLLAHLTEQPPDVLLADDLMGHDTVEELVRLARRGTFVLASVTTPSTIPGIYAFLDRVSDPRDAAPWLAGALTLRRIRRLCPECSREAMIDPAIQSILESSLGDIDGTRLMEGVGCETCFYSGFKGSIGLQELVVFDDDLRYMLGRRVLPSLLERNFHKRGLRTLLDDAARKAAGGQVHPADVQALVSRAVTRDPYESLGMTLRDLQAVL